MPLAIRVRLPTNDGSGVGVLGIAHVASFGKVYWPEAPEGEASEKATAVLQGVAVVFFLGGEVLAYKFCKTKKYHMFLLAVSVNLGRFVMLFNVICYRFVSSYPFETPLNERLNQFGPFLSVFRVSMNYMILHGNQVSESTCMKLLSKSASWFTSLTILGLGIPACVARPVGKKSNMKYSQTAKFAPWFWVFHLFYFTHGRSTKSSTHYFHGSATKTPRSWFVRDSRIPLTHGALAAKFERCPPWSHTAPFHIGNNLSIEFQKIHQQMCLENDHNYIYELNSICIIIIKI